MVHCAWKMGIMWAEIKPVYCTLETISNVSEAKHLIYYYIIFITAPYLPLMPTKYVDIQTDIRLPNLSIEQTHHAKESTCKSIL